jgi:hypothetical protein
MIHSKFIVEDGDIIIGRVDFHKKLVTDKSKVRGGGMYRMNHDKKEIVLSGMSYEFGSPDLSDIRNAVENDRVFTNPVRINSIANDFKFIWIEIDGERFELN